jgi:hypothetical protein
VHDLAVSKLVAGRGKDIDFIRDLSRHGMVQQCTLEARLADTEIHPERRPVCEGLLRRLFPITQS